MLTNSFRAWGEALTAYMLEVLHVFNGYRPVDQRGIFSVVLLSILKVINNQNYSKISSTCLLLPALKHSGGEAASVRMWEDSPTV